MRLTGASGGGKRVRKYNTDNPWVEQMCDNISTNALTVVLAGLHIAAESVRTETQTLWQRRHFTGGCENPETWLDKQSKAESVNVTQ